MDARARGLVEEPYGEQRLSHGRVGDRVSPVLVVQRASGGWVRRERGRGDGMSWLCELELLREK